MSVDILSGTGTNKLSVDANLAARITPYGQDVNPTGQKRTYRCSSTSAQQTFVTADVPFFNIIGSASTTVRVQRIILTGITLTAVAYLGISCGKYSSATTGGTSTTLTNTPLDSNSAAAGAVVKIYSLVGTAGSKVGDVATRRVMGQATAAAAAGIPGVVEFDFRNQGENSAIALRGTAQELGVYWETAPATGPTFHAEIEWTEE